MEALLGELQGTLVMHSTRFLEAEGEFRCAAGTHDESLTSPQISRTTCSSRSTASARCRSTTKRDTRTSGLPSRPPHLGHICDTSTLLPHTP
jgi:hypothetical protein